MLAWMEAIFHRGGHEDRERACGNHKVHSEKMATLRGPLAPVVSTEQRTDLLRSLLWTRCIYACMTPQPSVELSAFLDKLAVTLAGRSDIETRSMVDHPSMSLAGNLFRRRGDVDFFEHRIRISLDEDNRALGAIMGSTLFVAYFGAAKSLLDAVSIALTVAHALPLKPREQDFGKKPFWTALTKADSCPPRLAQLRAFADDVIRWRDAAVHRTSPLLVADGLLTTPLSEVRIVMADDPDDEVPWSGKKKVVWIDPLTLPNKWRPRFDELTNIAADAILTFALR
jgi:hypothetical protein